MLARSAAQSLARRAPVARAALTSTSTGNFSSTARTQNSLDYGVISKEDFGTFKEYSVIHTDRSLNLMSDPFQRVMRDLNQLLKVTYNADKVVIIPG
jgi:alanine-glyoxylate transaminase/serine-glyoxylate transaminase/serine-pyruvate transaminase